MSGSTNVRLPDGRTVSVPTSNPQAAAAAARKYLDNQPRPKPRTFLDRVDRAFTVASDLNDSFVDSVLPNWGDELRGVGRAAKALVTGKPVGPAFREGQRSFRADQERLEREHPVLKTSAQTAGVLASTVLPAGRALKGASMGRKMAQGGRVGALYGAAAGAGEGDGLDLGRRTSNAANGAVNGALTGAMLPQAGRLAQATGRAARRYVPGVDRAAQAVSGSLNRLLPPRLRRPAPSAAEDQAHRMLAGRMNEGTIANGLPTPGAPSNPQAIGAEVARRNDMGVPAMIGDVTQPMRDLTGWASRGVGPGQQMVRESLERRNLNAGTRVREHVQGNLPTTDDPIRFTEDLRRQSREAVAPLYDQAYAQPMQVTQEITGITQTPAFREALPQAHRNIQNQLDPATGRPKDPTAMGLRWFDGEPGSLAPNVPYAPAPGGGYVAMDKTLSTEGFDQVARAMSDSGRAASTVNPVTGRLESTTNSVHINNRARDLRRLIGDQNPAYAEAVGRYGDDAAYLNAFKQGEGIGNLTGHEINAQAREMPEFAREAWATGAGTKLADAASEYGAQHQNGNVANRVRQLLGDDAKQAAISDVTGNTGGVRRLQDQLEAEHQAHLNYRGAYGNSSTASRQAIDADLGEAAGIPLTKSGAMGRFVDFISSHAQTKFRKEVQRRVAEVVTASGAQSVSEVLQAIEATAARDRSFADAMHRAGIGTTAAYGVNVQPSDPIEAGDYRGY